MSIEWKIDADLVPYLAAVAGMEARVADIHAGGAPECVWLLEHPPLYTGGTSAKVEDLVDARFPVFETGRGGQYTYHGPGQRVAYMMLNLKQRQKTPDVKEYIWQLEEWIIRTLAEFGIKGERREGRVGIWVVHAPHPSFAHAQDTLSLRERVEPRSGEGEDKKTVLKESKIAAIGVRIRHGISYHGISINVNPDLSHFSGIVPCGISEHGVTSFDDLGIKIQMAELDTVLKQKFEEVFNHKDTEGTK